MSLIDSLLGSKRKADPLVGEMNAAKSQGIAASTQGLGELNTALGQDPSNMIKNQVYNQTKGVLTAAQDARRNAQKMMAQHGMQNSSLGLANQRSIDQNTGNQIADVNARMPGMIRDQQIQDAQTRMQAGTGLFTGMGGTQGVNYGGERSGGILGIAGALAPIAGAAGGMFMQNKAMNQQNDFQQSYLNKMK